MLTEAAIEMVDLSEHFEHMSRVICAHGKDRNMLILRKLRNPYKRPDGKIVGYELEHRWLSQHVTEPEAWVYVMGFDFTYWSLRELRETGFDIDNPTNLFDHFDLF